VNRYLWAIAFWAVVFLLLRWANRTRDAVHRGADLVKIARAVGGCVYSTATFPRPFVFFVADGLPCFIHQWMLFSEGLEVVTTLECRAGFPGFLEATTHGSRRPPSRAVRFKTLTHVEGFEIVTTDPGWGDQILEAGLRDILQMFRRVNHRARITLAADRLSIEVEARLRISEVRTMTYFMIGLALLSRSLARSSGVTILGEVTVAMHGRCPVCSQTVALPGVQCDRCRAPYHGDCWAYCRRCAIFGCPGAAAISASP